MYSFLSKQGRSILRNQSSSIMEGTMTDASDEYEELEEYMKYAHPDLFFKPKKLMDNEKELIEMTQPMTPTSDERSLKTTSLLIASRYLPSLNKELHQITSKSNVNVNGDGYGNGDGYDCANEDKFYF